MLAKAAAKESFKNIAKTTEITTIKATAETAAKGIAATKAAGARAIMAKLVIAGAFIGVGKHRISLINFLKFFLGGFAIRVEVRMVLLSQLFIGLFDSLLVSIAADAEHLIVIAFFCHVVLFHLSGLRQTHFSIHFV